MILGYPREDVRKILQALRVSIVTMVKRFCYREEEVPTPNNQIAPILLKKPLTSSV
jgi:hypothetical protein